MFTDRLLGVHVLMKGCKFRRTVGGITISLRNSRMAAIANSTERATIEHPRIVITNTNFEGCIFPHTYPAHIIGVMITGNLHNVHSFVNNHYYLLTIQNSTFKKAAVSLEISNRMHYYFATFAAIALIHLKGYKVVMAGGNYITSTQGYGLMLHSSQVELHGINEIRNSEIQSVRIIGSGGIYMSADSQLLLAPSTVLNVTSNIGFPLGGGIYISPDHVSLTAFVDCYVEFHDCPGWCFFQFINSDGQSVNASELAEHNATVLLTNNTATRGGNNIFNGHFQNYSLQTADVNGTLPASRQLILDVFHQYPPMDEEPIPSYPYAICLCIDGELNCIRNDVLVVDIYPVQNFPISVQVLGDWQQLLPVKLKVYGSSATNSYQLNEKNCTEVYNLGQPTPGSSHFLVLQAYLVADNYVDTSRYRGLLDRDLVVNVFNSCSPGLVYKQDKCTCNTFLKQHMFTCTQRTTATTYRTDQPHY